MPDDETHEMTISIVPFAGDASYLALLVRVLFGVSLMIHGYPKLKGGWKQAGQWMKSMGIPAGTAIFATIIEFFGGLLFIIGLIVPIVAAFTAIQFGSIIAMKKSKMKASYVSMDPSKPSYEIDVFYLIVALVLLVLGAGALSVDSLIF